VNGFGRKGLVAAMSLVLFTAVFSAFPAFASWNLWPSGKYRYDDASRYNAGGTSIDEMVNSLDISWVSGDVEVEYWDGSTIEVMETFSSKISDDALLRWRVKSGRLYVKYTKTDFAIKNVDKNLIVRIPRGLVLRDVDIETVSADTTLSIQADALDFESVSGSLRAQMDYVKEIELETVSGEISLSLGVCPREIEGKSVSGSFSIALPEGSLYAVEFDSVSGRLRSSSANLSGGASYNPKGASSRFEFETVSGDVSID